MAAAESDRPKDGNEQNVQNEYEDETRESLGTNILKHTVTKQSTTKEFLRVHGQQRTFKHLEIDEYIDRTDAKNRQKREVSESGLLIDSDFIKMVKHIFKANPLMRLPHIHGNLKKYKKKETEVDYNLDARSLMNYFSINKYASNESDNSDNRNSVFEEDLSRYMHIENPANIYKRDYVNLLESEIKKSQNSNVVDFNIESNSNIATKPTSNWYLNPKQGNNYQHRHEKPNNSKKKDMRFEFDIDNKHIKKLWEEEDKDEEEYANENNVLAEDTGKISYIHIYTVWKT